MAKKAWGGRFKKETNPVVERFSASIATDIRLAQVDIQGSIAHASMLFRMGLISSDDRAAIVKGLKQLSVEFEQGKVDLDPKCEDIHMLVERRLADKIGPVAGKLHTARSRNDQVALDLRMWCRQAAANMDQELKGIQEVLLDLSQKHLQDVLPGYTHLQHAQPVTLGHHLLAYFWMFDRDRDRLADWLERSNFCPLGAAALAGTSLPIDREFTAEALRFDGAIPNSMDAVSDRDFAIELVFTCTLVMTHLSRLSEEMVLWASAEFHYIDMDDSVATGSSIMPQKKNPDVAELVRGKFGRVQGALVALTSLLKGLPLTYMRDLQEDKPPLFDAVDTTTNSLEAMTTLLQNITFRTKDMAVKADDGFSTATDLAEYLVREGVPFREAHEVVGNLVRKCLDENKRMDALKWEDLKTAHSAFGEDALISLETQASLNSRVILGGTAPEAVAIQLESARQSFEERG